MKDAVRLAVYFVAVIVVGALIAPILFWSGRILAHHPFEFLARFDFELFFHRALLISAVLFLWPLLRAVGVRRLGDLGLHPNKQRWRDLAAGFLIALLPLTICAAGLIILHVYTMRSAVQWVPLSRTVIAAIVVPWIEETFFRGLVLGILLRSGRKYFALVATSALFSVVHFLKAPEGTSSSVTWSSGFQSIAHSFAQFSEPMLVLAGFTTLFLIGWILAHARIRTNSLWLPIGLHAGWIFGNGVFTKLARRELLLLPWLGRNLLVGLIPLVVLCITWMIVCRWLNREPST